MVEMRRRMPAHFKNMNVALHRTRSGSLILLTLFALTARLLAAGPLVQVPVKGVLGRAQYSRANGPFIPLGPGMSVRGGDVVQTANGSAVDLDFGSPAGLVRLTENAVLHLDALNKASTNQGGATEIKLNLKSGELLGIAKRVPDEGRFEIKIPVGLVQILEGRYRIDARGYIVLVEGKALLAYVPATGEPQAHTLTAPKPVYFSPAEGLNFAPKELEREVDKQLRAKLPRK
jgi:hypothetical protein